jgi:hypothetical protein
MRYKFVAEKHIKVATLVNSPPNWDNLSFVCGKECSVAISQLDGFIGNEYWTNVLFTVNLRRQLGSDSGSPLIDEVMHG